MRWTFRSVRTFLDTCCPIVWCGVVHRFHPRLLARRHLRALRWGQVLLKVLAWNQCKWHQRFAVVLIHSLQAGWLRVVFRRYRAVEKHWKPSPSLLYFISLALHALRRELRKKPRVLRAAEKRDILPCEGTFVPSSVTWITVSTIREKRFFQLRENIVFSDVFVRKLRELRPIKLFLHFHAFFLRFI